MLAAARNALLLSALAALAWPAPASAAPPGARGMAVPLPPPPAGTTLLPRSGSGRTVLVGGKAGLASPLGNGGDAGTMLLAEAALPWRTTASGISLSWVLPVRTTFLATLERAGLEAGGLSLEATPTARASVPLGRSSFSFRTEAGLGIVSSWTWQQVDTRFVGRKTETGQETTGVVRLGLGLDWALTPSVAIALDPLSFGFDLQGNADWTFAAGATYRL